MPYAGKVGHRRNTGFMLDAQYHLAGELAGGTSRAVRHTDETGPVGLQFTDGLVQSRRRLLIFGREKFKGQAGAGSRLQSFSQVHFSLLGLAGYGSASRFHGNHHRFGSFHGDGGGGRSHSGLVFFRHVFLPACRRNNDFIPRLDGFLVIIIKKRITLHVGLEYLPVRVNPVDNQGYENASASADSQFLPHFQVGRWTGTEPGWRHGSTP